jgi:hypothetical protein
VRKNESSSQSDQTTTDGDSTSISSSEYDDHEDLNCIKTKCRLKKVKELDSSSDEDLNCIKAKCRPLRKVRLQQHLLSNEESSDEDQKLKAISIGEDQKPLKRRNHKTSNKRVKWIRL